MRLERATYAYIRHLPFQVVAFCGGRRVVGGAVRGCWPMTQSWPVPATRPSARQACLLFLFHHLLRCSQINRPNRISSIAARLHVAMCHCHTCARWWAALCGLRLVQICRSVAPKPPTLHNGVLESGVPRRPAAVERRDRESAKIPPNKCVQLRIFQPSRPRFYLLFILSLAPRSAFLQHPACSFEHTGRVP